MKERNIVLCIILTLLTCGLYGIYWIVVLTDDVVYANDKQVFNTSGGASVVFGLLTCGLYYIYWSYQMGKGVQRAQELKGAKTSDNSLLYVILLLFGFNLISLCMIQNDMNKLPRESNVN